MADAYAAKRTEILNASMDSANEPGWGYFGMTGCLAIGDNSYAPSVEKKPPPQEEGAEPLRNVCSKPTLKGSSTDVYFQFETPLALGDPFKEPAQMGRGTGKVKMLDPDASFKPPGKVKVSSNKLGYQYVEHCDTAKDPKEVKEFYKDRAPVRQIVTNPLKKGGGGVLTGGVLFGFDEAGRFPEHVPDDYDSAKKQRLKDLEEHKAKVQEAPFKGIDYGDKPFANNVDSFYCEIPSHVPREEPPEDTKGRYPHEMAFKPSHPSKKGSAYGCMGGIPKYVADPMPPGATRKPKDDNAPAPFKNGLPNKVCNPMPSVVTNVRNMRNERPRSFMRPLL